MSDLNAIESADKATTKENPPHVETNVVVRQDGNPDIGGREPTGGDQAKGSGEQNLEEDDTRSRTSSQAARWDQLVKERTTLKALTTRRRNELDGLTAAKGSKRAMRALIDKLEGHLEKMDHLTRQLQKLVLDKDEDEAVREYCENVRYMTSDVIDQARESLTEREEAGEEESVISERNKSSPDFYGFGGDAGGKKNTSGKDGLSGNPHRGGEDDAANTPPSGLNAAAGSRVRFYDTQSEADAHEAQRAKEEAAAHRQKAERLEEKAKAMQRRVEQRGDLIEQVQREVLQAEEAIRAGQAKKDNALRSLEELSNTGGIGGQRRGVSEEVNDQRRGVSDKNDQR